VKLCRVVGQVVATAKHPALQGRKIMVVRPEPDRGDPTEAMQLALDGVGAGLGSVVMVTESGAAGRLVTGAQHPPVRSVIVGIVD
jgi:ethanolamine utilization protein EutN